MSCALIAEAWRWKLVGVVSAIATFALMVVYASAMRHPYAATARITIGHVATQLSGLGPAVFVPIEDVAQAERHTQRETLSERGTAAACSVQGRVGEGFYLHIACSAGDREEANRRVSAIADSVIKRHGEKFDIMLQPLRQTLGSEKSRLDRMTALQQKRQDQPPAGSGEGFLLANEILSLQASLEMNTLLRKLDRMTALDPPGVIVTEKRLTPPTLAAAFFVSLAFGAFVSLAFAAAAIMRRAGWGGSPSP